MSGIHFSLGAQYFYSATATSIRDAELTKAAEIRRNEKLIFRRPREGMHTGDSYFTSVYEDFPNWLSFPVIRTTMDYNISWRVTLLVEAGRQKQILAK